MNEIELKFGLAVDQLPAAAKALRRGATRSERLQAAYFDTADARLSAHGMSLRLRKEGGRWVQTAKAATGQSIARLEHNAEVPPPQRGQAPAIDLSRHDGFPVAAALHKALARGDPQPLELRFQTDVLRTSRTLRSGGARIELALDTGAVVANGLSDPIRELEMELKSGPVAALVDLAARWVGPHGLWLSTVSKAERGALLRDGKRWPDPTKAAAPKSMSPATGRAFLAATLESCMAQVLANASAIAAGADDAELVHQLRVGVRRLRTALRELGAFAGAGSIDPGWDDGLRKVFHELGEVRDRAVVLPQIQAELAAAGAPALQGRETKNGARAPTAVVRDADFQRLLLALVGFAHALTAAAPAGGDDPRAAVAQRLDQLLHRIGRDARRFDDLDTARQHRVRKRLKRLRYLSEFAMPLFGAGRVGRYLDHWRRAQDALGSYNDERVAADLFRADVAVEPGAWFAVGWLEARKGAAVKRCRRALREAAKAKPFWRAATA